MKTLKNVRISALTIASEEDAPGLRIDANVDGKETGCLVYVDTRLYAAGANAFLTALAEQMGYALRSIGEPTEDDDPR